MKDVQNDLKLIEKYKIPTFIPLKFKDCINIETKFYYFNDIEQRRFNNNVVDITKPRCYKSITSYKALAISCFLGFKNIYIAGYDNNYFKTIEVDKNNKIHYLENHVFKQGGTDKYSYEKDKSLNLAKLLLIWSYSFLDLCSFPKNIINLDENSLIDAFKKHNIFND